VTLVFADGRRGAVIDGSRRTPARPRSPARAEGCEAESAIPGQGDLF
jgi:hypothetical protein